MKVWGLVSEEKEDYTIESALAPWRGDTPQNGSLHAYVVFCSPFPHRSQQTTVTFLPGHVIITDVSERGTSETIVTLYIALPLSATPLDPDNPTIPGDVTAAIVQAAESSIEAALGFQVCG